MSRVGRRWRKRQLKVRGAACSWWRRYYRFKGRHGPEAAAYWYAVPWQCPAPVKPSTRRARG